MDTLIFTSILFVGGALMYMVGHWHGYDHGRHDALKKVSARHPFRSIIYDAYDK